MDLSNKRCIPCEVGGKALKPEEVSIFMQGLSGWKVEGDIKIKKEFVFGDFTEAMIFVNKVASIAEVEGHHPDFHIYFNKVMIELQTHAVSGLTENDFILATKIDKAHA